MSRRVEMTAHASLSTQWKIRNYTRVQKLKFKLKNLYSRVRKWLG